MSWVAFDRGIRLATIHGRPAPLDRWQRERDAIYHQIMQRGWSTRRQAFVQHYRTEVLDSSLLRMSTVGFVTPMDPTVALHAGGDGGRARDRQPHVPLRPGRLTGRSAWLRRDFSLCTFAYVDSLARAGQLDKARVVFEKMLTYANHLGLYSEEIALTGEQIGNFPQAFTHLSLIDAAITLDRQLDRRSATGSAR